MSNSSIRPGFPGDPFKEYGVRFAAHVMGTIRTVPREFREVALEALLDQLDDGLFARVTKRANTYRESGLRTKAAVRSAIASTVSQSFAEQVVEAGRGRAPVLQSLAGLGLYEDAEEAVLAGYRHALGLCGPKCWARKAKKAAKKVGSTVKKAGKKVGRAGKKVGRTAKSAAKKIGRTAKRGAKKAYAWGKSAVKLAKELGCRVTQSGAADMAAGAAAGAYGAPPQVGVAGNQAISQTLCGGAPPMPSGTVPGESLDASARPSWVVPLALGSAAVIGTAILWRRR